MHLPLISKEKMKSFRQHQQHGDYKMKGKGLLNRQQSGRNLILRPWIILSFICLTHIPFSLFAVPDAAMALDVHALAQKQQTSTDHNGSIVKNINLHRLLGDSEGNLEGMENEKSEEAPDDGETALSQTTQEEIPEVESYMNEFEGENIPDNDSMGAMDNDTVAGDNATEDFENNDGTGDDEELNENIDDVEEELEEAEEELLEAELDYEAVVEEEGLEEGDIESNVDINEDPLSITELDSLINTFNPDNVPGEDGLTEKVNEEERPTEVFELNDATGDNGEDGDHAEGENGKVAEEMPDVGDTEKIDAMQKDMLEKELEIEEAEAKNNDDDNEDLKASINELDKLLNDFDEDNAPGEDEAMKESIEEKNPTEDFEINKEIDNDEVDGKIIGENTNDNVKEDNDINEKPDFDNYSYYKKEEETIIEELNDSDKIPNNTSETEGVGAKDEEVKTVEKDSKEENHEQEKGGIEGLGKNVTSTQNQSEEAIGKIDAKDKTNLSNEKEPENPQNTQSATKLPGFISKVTNTTTISVMKNGANETKVVNTSTVINSVEVTNATKNTHQTKITNTQKTNTAAKGLDSDENIEESSSPTREPTGNPTSDPTAKPTAMPTAMPTATPTANPTKSPSLRPTTKAPSRMPTSYPTINKGAIEATAEKKVVKKIGGWVVFSALIGMIFTAHQMSENPDGFFASCCRLAITISGCILKIVLLPCKKLFGNRFSGYTHHLVATDYRDPYIGRSGHLELS